MTVNKLQLMSITLTSFATAYSSTYIFSYVGFLSKDFGNLSSANESGYIAGYISGAMYFGRCFTAFIWGFLSDKYGRRPTLLFSALSSVFFPLMFGFATKIELLLLFRLLLGFFNGTVPISRACLPEIATEKDLPLVFSVTSTAWSMGRILGPAISGWATYIPPESEEVIESNLTEEITYERYFLASFICSTLGFIAFLSLFLFFTESLESKKSTNLEKEKFIVEENIKEVKLSTKDILCSRKFIGNMFVYSTFSFTVTFVNDVLPLWAISSVSKGGLNLGTNLVGTIFAFGGIAMLFSSVAVYKVLDSKVKIKTSFMSLSLLYSFLIFLLPRISSFFDEKYSFYAVIGVNCVREFLEVIIFNTLFILTNNSVPIEVKGTATGISLAFASLFKMLGPVVGAPLFAWTISDELKSSWIGYTLAFDVDAFIVLTAVCMAFFCVPNSINHSFDNNTEK